MRADFIVNALRANINAAEAQRQHADSEKLRAAARSARRAAAVSLFAIPQRVSWREGAAGAANSMRISFRILVPRFTSLRVRLPVRPTTATGTVLCVYCV
jgi:hypothetical protein